MGCIARFATPAKSTTHHMPSIWYQTSHNRLPQKIEVKYTLSEWGSLDDGRTNNWNSVYSTITLEQDYLSDINSRSLSGLYLNIYILGLEEEKLGHIITCTGTCPLLWQTFPKAATLAYKTNSYLYKKLCYTSPNMYMQLLAIFLTTSMPNKSYILGKLSP